MIATPATGNPRNVQSEIEMPRGWTRATVGDTGQFVNGLAFKESDWGTEGLPIIRIQNLTESRKPFNRTTRVVDPVYIVERGDILVSWSATLDAFAWQGETGVLNQHIFKVITDERIVDSRFHFHMLRWAIAQMRASAHVHGSTMKHINRGPFLAFEIPLPPLSEQRRIVAEIETLFTRLDAAVAALERVRANLKRYRQAIINAACSGDIEHHDARSLSIDGRRTETTDQTLNGLPEGWEWTVLGEHLREPLRNGHSAKASGTDQGIRTLTLSAVTNRDFSERNTKLTVADSSRVKDLWLEPGDIFVERSNTPELVGTAALFRGDRGFSIFPDLLIRVRAAEPLSAPYLEIVLRSDRSRQFFRQRAKGIAGSMPKIDQATISELPVPLPPIQEQIRIVSDIERQLSLVENITSILDVNHDRADRMRQSILHKAFAGQLVPQEPADEPAIVLLERIRAERPASAKADSRKSRPRLIGLSLEVQRPLH